MADPSLRSVPTYVNDAIIVSLCKSRDSIELNFWFVGTVPNNVFCVAQAHWRRRQEPADHQPREHRLRCQASDRSRLVRQERAVGHQVLPLQSGGEECQASCSGRLVFFRPMQGVVFLIHFFRIQGVSALRIRVLVRKLHFSEFFQQNYFPSLNSKFVYTNWKACRPVPYRFTFNFVGYRTYIKY